jgi:hypothetical protein
MTHVLIKTQSHIWEEQYVNRKAEMGRYVYKVNTTKNCQQTTRSLGRGWEGTLPHSPPKEPALPIP